MHTRSYLVAIVGSALMFLSATSAAWTVEENYDGLSVGDGTVRCPPFWNVPGARTTITSDNKFSGANSCKFAVTKDFKGWGGGFVLPTFLAINDELWVRFRLYIPPGFSYFVPDSDGARLKFIRMAVRNPSAPQNEARLDWYWQREGSSAPYGVILERDECTTNCWQYFGAGDEPQRGTWETYEMYAKFDYVSADAGGQGRVRAWKNGKLIADLTNRPTMWRDVNGNLGGDSTEIVSIMILAYWNGGAPATQFLYFDDLLSTDVAPGTTCDGFPCIGVGDFVYVAPPGSPTTVTPSTQTLP